MASVESAVLRGGAGVSHPLAVKISRRPGSNSLDVHPAFAARGAPGSDFTDREYRLTFWISRAVFSVEARPALAAASAPRPVSGAGLTLAT